MRVAVVQMTSGADKELNLATADRLVGDAVAAGAERLVLLPEMFNVLGAGHVLRAGAEPLDGPTSAWARDQAVSHGITLAAGTFIEVGDAGDGRNYNTACVYGPDGQRLATYRKIHLFDVEVPGAEFHESEAVVPGEEIVTTKVGAEPIIVGSSICYDVRFPELYRIAALRGALAMTVPAAFTAKTGPPHWEILLRARAIENQVFVIAAGQCGWSNDTLHWHGHSMIIDPWGTVLAHTPDDGAASGLDAQPGAAGAVVVADLDLASQSQVRATLPSLANRRPATYLWP